MDRPLYYRFVYDPAPEKQSFITTMRIIRPISNTTLSYRSQMRTTAMPIELGGVGELPIGNTTLSMTLT